MDESQFKTFREISRDGTLSQRDLSKRTGLSLARVNYLVNVLLRKGYIKAKKVKTSRKKIGYQTQNFLQKKLDEYDKLTREIEILRQENLENHNYMKKKL